MTFRNYVQLRSLPDGSTELSVDIRRFELENPVHTPKLLRNPLIFSPLTSARPTIRYQGPRNQVAILRGHEEAGSQQHRAIAPLWNEVRSTVRDLLDPRVVSFLESQQAWTISDINVAHNTPFIQLMGVSPLLAQSLFLGHVLHHGDVNARQLLQRPLTEVAATAINRFGHVRLTAATPPVMAWLKSSPMMQHSTGHQKFRNFGHMAEILRTSNLDRVRNVPLDMWETIYAAVEINRDLVPALLKNGEITRRELDNYFPAGMRVSFPDRFAMHRSAIEQISRYVRSIPTDFSQPVEVTSLIRTANKARRWHRDKDFRMAMENERNRRLTENLDYIVFPRLQLREQVRVKLNNEDYVVEPILTTQQMDAEGMLMSNCLSSQLDRNALKCASGESFMFAVGRPGGSGRRYSLELASNLTLAQFETFGNQKVSHDLAFAVRDAIAAAWTGEIAPIKMINAKATGTALEIRL